jgi:hypothetical protein
MPRRTTIAAAALAALALATMTAAPASAAGKGAPSVKSKGEYTVYEGAYTALNFQYKCAAGHTATVAAEIWQGGTAEAPVSLYTTELSPAPDLPDLVCDGKKHLDRVGLYLDGWTEENPTSQYDYFGDTSAGFGRGNVTIVITDTTTGVSDTDRDRIGVTSRDNPL